MPILIPIPGFKWFHVFCAWSVLLLGHAPSSQESSNARLRSQVAQIPQYFLSPSSFLVGNDGEHEFFLGFHNASRKASKIPWWEMNMSVSVLRNSAKGNLWDVFFLQNHVTAQDDFSTPMRKPLFSCVDAWVKVFLELLWRQDSFPETWESGDTLGRWRSHLEVTFPTREYTVYKILQYNKTR